MTGVAGILALLVPFVVIPAPGLVPEVRAQGTRPWAVSWSIGVAEGHQIQDLEATFNHVGLRQPDCSLAYLFGCQIPGAGASSPSVAVTLRVPIARLWNALLLLGTGNLGTVGYYNGSMGGNLELTATTFAVIPTLQPSAGLWMGAGPAIYVVSVTPVDGSAERHTRFGGVAQAGVTLPARSRFFLEAVAEYRLVGAADIGPFAIVPPSRLNFNHGRLGIGLGVRW